MSVCPARFFPWLSQRPRHLAGFSHPPAETDDTAPFAPLPFTVTIRRAVVRISGLVHEVLRKGDGQERMSLIRSDNLADFIVILVRHDHSTVRQPLVAKQATGIRCDYVRLRPSVEPTSGAVGHHDRVSYVMHIIPSTPPPGARRCTPRSSVPLPRVLLDRRRVRRFDVSFTRSSRKEDSATTGNTCTNATTANNRHRIACSNSPQTENRIKTCPEKALDTPGRE